MKTTFRLSTATLMKTKTIQFCLFSLQMCQKKELLLEKLLLVNYYMIVQIKTAEVFRTTVSKILFACLYVAKGHLIQIWRKCFRSVSKSGEQYYNAAHPWFWHANSDLPSPTPSGACSAHLWPPADPVSQMKLSQRPAHLWHHLFIQPLLGESFNFRLWRWAACT